MNFWVVFLEFRQVETFVWVPDTVLRLVIEVALCRRGFCRHEVHQIFHSSKDITHSRFKHIEVQS